MSRRIRPPALIAGIVAGGLVIVGMALVFQGLPEQTAAQRAMLGYSQVAFALAAVVAIAEMVWERKAWRRRSFRVVASIAGLLLGIAVVGVIGNAILDGWTWVRNGIAPGLGWAGIGVLFVWLGVDSARRDRRLRKRWIAEGEAVED